ncbi:hypothetical protein DEI81_02915 [Curtobacterium sp. MCBD17_013]|uniref:hypothetical protein n=1 Tax=Curtobacterium sp. MCBD17_013 TaxID=2175668 RepID=UPI000DA92DDF|nr:hypothetical protein [Curtobacterium sp. MCBD17_013]PZF65072.1 hypothetical protein DEI81_02915 [Curtobacterium sp. MCBD17_013]
MSNDGTSGSDREWEPPIVDGEPVTAERLERDLSFDIDAAPADDALTDDDARTADLEATEAED